jgi:hypothetical protein
MKPAGSEQPEATAKHFEILSFFDVQTITLVMLIQNGIQNTIIITANTGVVNSFSESPVVRSMDYVDNKT